MNEYTALKLTRLFVLSFVLLNGSAFANDTHVVNDDAEAISNNDKVVQDILFSQGKQVISLSSYLNQQAQYTLQQSNQVRKRLIKLKRDNQIRDNENFQTFSTELLDLFDGMRKEASQLRSNASLYRENALTLLRFAFSQRLLEYGITVSETSLDDLTQTVRAFNPRLMSSKPKMIDKVEAENRSLDDKRLILLNERLAEQNKPKKLDTKPIQISRNQQYIAYFSGENSTIPLNKIHTWEFVITDIAGHVDPDIQVKIKGDMPGHNHGLPTSPKLVHTEQEGRYKVKGMKFQMPGWWVITFNVEKDGQKDQLVFNIDL